MTRLSLDPAILTVQFNLKAEFIVFADVFHKTTLAAGTRRTAGNGESADIQCRNGVLKGYLRVKLLMPVQPTQLHRWHLGRDAPPCGTFPCDWFICGWCGPATFFTHRISPKP